MKRMMMHRSMSHATSEDGEIIRNSMNRVMMKAALGFSISETTASPKYEKHRLQI